MKTICLYFNVHQPFRFKRYRFFDIGTDHYYYDDYLNEAIMRKIAEKCYLPANNIILGLIKEYGCNFKVSYSISGLALDQFEMYAPEVLESFQTLSKSRCVEFIGETYSHSLASLINKEEFKEQVENHSQKMEKYFGQRPTVFRNSELIYSDEIGSMVADLGFKGMLTEGAKHVLGWKSPNYLYCNAINPRLKVLLRNYRLSDDLTFRFSNHGWSEFPLTTEKFVGWINNADKKEEIFNVFIDYETFGEHQKVDTGIFEFLKALPRTVFAKSKITFSTPSDIINDFQPVAAVNILHPVSWADEERDLTAWLGNDLQKEAFSKLNKLYDLVKDCSDPKIKQDWKYLQTSDHFYYMSTKFFSDGDIHKYFNPYNSPYDAFINYMNILSDFTIRVNESIIANSDVKSIGEIEELLAEKEKLVSKYEDEIKKLKEQQGETVKDISKRQLDRPLTKTKSPLKKSKSMASAENIETTVAKTKKTKTPKKTVKLTIVEKTATKKAMIAKTGH
jgi:alpha-amylase